MQRIRELVNSWFRFSMSRTGYIRPVLTITAVPQSGVTTLLSTCNKFTLFAGPLQTAGAQCKSRAQKNCKHKK